MTLLERLKKRADNLVEGSSEETEYCKIFQNISLANRILYDTFTSFFLQIGYCKIFQQYLLQCQRYIVRTENLISIINTNQAMLHVNYRFIIRYIFAAVDEEGVQKTDENGEPKKRPKKKR